MAPGTEPSRFIEAVARTAPVLVVPPRGARREHPLHPAHPCFEEVGLEHTGVSHANHRTPAVLPSNNFLLAPRIPESSQSVPSGESPPPGAPGAPNTPESCLLQDEATSSEARSGLAPDRAASRTRSSGLAPRGRRATVVIESYSGDAGCGSGVRRRANVGGSRLFALLRLAGRSASLRSVSSRLDLRCTCRHGARPTRLPLRAHARMTLNG